MLKAIPLAVAALAATAPLPDILLPGQRSVAHELVLEIAPGCRPPELVAFPTQGLGVARRVMPGEPFRFSSKYGTCLYELASGEALPPGADRDWAVSHVALAIPVVEEGTVLLSSPVRRLRTTLRLSGAAGSLRLDVMGTERFDRNGEPMGATSSTIWFLLLSSLGAAWLFRLGRIRRRREPT